MVLFVTGLCPSSCYYCPLSSEKAGNDVIFADEMPVSKDDDILYESRMIGAEGVGISGGDPLCQLERTQHYIELLREEFGPNYHIHLYTSETEIGKSVLEGLISSGLDEIRFHPQSSKLSGIKAAVDMDIEVGIEVPAIPGKTDSLRETAERAEQMGVKFLNINELEISETNFGKLSALGMRLTDMSSASVQGSRQAAIEILEWATEHLSDLSVHFCSAHFKDAIQMRRRLERRLENVIRPFEERVDDDPLLILGLIRAPHGKLLLEDDMSRIYDALVTDFEIPNDLMNLDWARMRIEIAPWIIEEVADDVRRRFESDLEMGIAYEYPSWDRLQTLFEPV
jgi:pyruvate formate-lyase activating enzyme-like uncharacterized protein